MLQDMRAVVGDLDGLLYSFLLGGLWGCISSCEWKSGKLCSTALTLSSAGKNILAQLANVVSFELGPMD